MRLSSHHPWLPGRQPVLRAGQEELVELADPDLERHICRREHRLNIPGHIGWRRGQDLLPVLVQFLPGRGLVGEEQAGVIDAVLAHAGEIIKALGVERGQRGKRGGSSHQIREQGSARQYIRAAARVAPRHHAIDAQLSADRADIGGAVGDGAAWLGRGLPEARPVVADKPQPALGGIPHVRAIKRGVPGARRAVVDKDRPASGITAIFDSQQPAVCGVNCALHAASFCTALSRP